MRAILACGMVCLTSALLSADLGPPADLRDQSAKAAKILVGKVVNVDATFAPNEFGDRIIISRVYVQPEEVLKGTVTSVIEVQVEGGTVGDVTLQVSDMPALRANERAIFFLDAAPAGSHRPHARGHGILKLDASNRIQGTTLQLDDVKAIVKAAAGRN